MFHIAMFGCAHLGYAPTELRRKLPDGTNVIAADGYAAHRQTVTDICSTLRGLPGSGVLVDGGDLAHTANPTPASIDVALDVDQIRANAGIEGFRIPGNHCRSSSAATPATAMLRRAPGSHIIAPKHYGVGDDPDDPRREVIADGLYEVWHFQNSAEDDGPPVHLHFINEQALAPSAEDMDAAVDPRAVTSGVNVLITHGIVPDDTQYYVQADERGGNRVIPRDWFDRGFNAALLSDFHTPSTGTLGGTPWAYTGSAVRRGFADAESPRGWILVTVDDEGRVSFGFNAVDAQRPAVDESVDLPDDPAAAVAAVSGVLSDLEPRSTDAASGERTGEAGVRIRVTAHAPSTAVYDAAAAMIPEWERMLPDALSLEVRVTGAGTPRDLDSALSSIPDVADESTASALRRLAAAGVLDALENMSEAEIAEVLDEADTALAV